MTACVELNSPSLNCSIYEVFIISLCTLGKYIAVFYFCHGIFNILIFLINLSKKLIIFTTIQKFGVSKIFNGFEKSYMLTKAAFI